MPPPLAIGKKPSENTEAKQKVSLFNDTRTGRHVPVLTPHTVQRRRYRSIGPTVVRPTLNRNVASFDLIDRCKLTTVKWKNARNEKPAREKTRVANFFVQWPEIVRAFLGRADHTFFGVRAARTISSSTARGISAFLLSPSTPPPRANKYAPILRAKRSFWTDDARTRVAAFTTLFVVHSARVCVYVCVCAMNLL